jgi:glycosyltransferase involved in cell wall biosynthesis
MVACCVDVLLATYNGQRFLPSLLDSLLAQNFNEFSILARDDCSDDSTPQILAEYAAKFPGRIKILPPPQQRSGPCANFAALLASTAADFVFLCDQDDVWLPDKMAVTYAAMERLVARHGPLCPLLVHTDLVVVDAELEPLSTSSYRYVGLDPQRNALGELLLGNVATGCTILMNRPLYEAARPIPHVALMHDHWITQVAAAVGHIEFLDEATILYRQHGANAVGAVPSGLSQIWKDVRRTFFSDRSLRVLHTYADHARVLRARFGNQLDARGRDQVTALADIWSLPRWRRFPRLFRAGLRKSSMAANMAMFLLLLTGDGRPRNGQSDK